MFLIASMFSVNFTPKTWRYLCLLNWSNTYMLGRDMVGGGTDVAKRNTVIVSLHLPHITSSVMTGPSYFTCKIKIMSVLPSQY